MPRGALEGIEIGWLSERIHARQFEPKVIQATKTRKALTSGRAKKATKAESRHNEICKWVAHRLKQYPKDTLTYARTLAATQFYVSLGTVKTATANVKKARKKMKK